MTAIGICFLAASAALIWDILAPLLETTARDHTIGILAGLEANKGVVYRYPYALRFIK